MIQPRAYTGDREMLDSEFKRWHDKQKKREEALKQVEDNVITVAEIK